MKDELGVKSTQHKEGQQMGKALTKNQIIAGVAEGAGLSKKDAAAALETLVCVAYKGAADGFTIPGLGKLVLVQRNARKGRNPATGEEIMIPAKKVVKFRVAKAAKEAILAGGSCCCCS